jgi:Xaa-Pro dipeptidase
VQLLTGIPTSELEARRARLLEYFASNGLTGGVLFDDRYVQYFTSFNFLATERPVGVAIDARGSLAVFVPEFEVERVRAETTFERVESYPEYPGLEHPMRLLGDVLEDMGIVGAIGADSDGYPGILGYQGPSLTDVLGAEVTPLGPQIESQMVRKSEAEVELIRESARWCEYAHRLVQEYSVPGSTEAQAGLRAGYEASLAMLEALGPGYSGQLSSTDGASAGYRGQVGQRSAWAHAVAHNIPFEAGQVLVTETAAPVWGYNAELERAMIIGTPTDEMRRLFDHTVAAQQAAFDALRPGVTCADVDQAVIDYLEANDLLHYWRQHVGHGIGLRNHEAPFLDIGDLTVVETGMVFTIEPGLYDDVVGGFRHSDTVVVTEDGIDILTSYPKDIESLTIPA